VTYYNCAMDKVSAGRNRRSMPTSCDGLGDRSSEPDLSSRVSFGREDVHTRKARVLIVDDGTAFRMAARELLERRGYRVDGEADSVATAITLVERLAPDGVLVDVYLPDGNGFQLATRLRDTHPGLAVLMASGEIDASFYARAAACGACGFVPKNQLAEVDLEGIWLEVRIR